MRRAITVVFSGFGGKKKTKKCKIYSKKLRKIIEKLKAYGFKEIITAQAGPSISIHCGKKTLGIMYIKE